MTNEDLMTAARNAAQYAYAPYSGYRVGAALLCADGQVYTGCNVENASYGAAICAERTAVGKAVSDGNRDFVKIAVTGSGTEPAYPCGICRQVLLEFGLQIRVLTEHDGIIEEYALSELLPHGFMIKKGTDECK